MSDPSTVAVPVLPVVDLIRAVAFYERLGFVVRELFGEAGYAITAFDGAEVHLAEMAHMAGIESPAGAYLRVAEVDRLHAAWTAAGARVIAPPTDQPYGIREFATEDLDGNLWRVGAPISPPAPDGMPAAWTDGPGAAPSAPSADGVATFSVDAEQEPPSDQRFREGGGDVLSDSEPDLFALVSGTEPCPGCGWDPEAIPARALGAQVRDVAHELGLLLAGADDDAVRRRPAPGVWSALEAGVHTRDVLRVFGERVVLTLALDEPDLVVWDHLQAMADQEPNEADAGAVADDLGRNAAHLSEALRQVGDDDFSRGATRGSDRFTIELLARYTLHEVVHHLVDARRALAVTAG